MAQRTSGGRVPATIAVVAGTLAVVGSLLAWAEASVGPASFSAAGIEGWEGKATLVGGVLLLVGGASAFLGAAGAAARLRALALLGGVMAAGVGIYTALTAQDQILGSAAAELAGQLGISVTEARATLEASLDEGVLSLSLQVGIWLVIAGGVTGVAAGAWAFAAGGARAARNAPVPVGGGLTGWATPAPDQVPPRPPAGGGVREPTVLAAPPPVRPGEAPLTSSVWATPPPAAEREDPDRGVAQDEATEHVERAEDDPGGDPGVSGES